MKKTEKLRLGVMCLGHALPDWQKRCIENMLATGHVELSLVILDAPENYPSTSSWNKVRQIESSKLLFTAYTKILYKPRSVATQDASSLFADIPVISCVVQKKGKYSQYFSTDDIQVIRSYQLDIILRFGFNIIRGEILKTATYGVWSFHHDDEMKYRGGPPCFWEIYRGDPETGAVLQKLTDKLDGGVVLKKGIFRTKRYSYQKNVDQAYYESAKWPAWVCRDIVNGSAAYIGNPPTPTQAPIYRYPTNSQFFRFGWILFANFLRHVYFRLFVMQRWNVALLKGNMAMLQTTPHSLPRTFLKQRNKHSFNADCFGAATEEGIAVFYEELDYSKQGKGEIKLAKFDQGGKEIGYAIPEGLDIQTHASYPYLFRENGAVFMIPETGAAKKVSLFRSEEFPARWTWEADLLKGQAISDATLLHHQGMYWLFFTIHSNQFDADLHLHLAYSTSLGNAFTFHPQNPVKISARSARPAGTPYLDPDGNLIRPAQNFCRTYGGSVVLNKITTLSTTDYAEEEIGEVKPFDSYYKDGLHTVAVVNDDFLLVDMKRHVFRLLAHRH